MNTNLDKIALDLYGKIETRFPNVKIGDENAEVLSKKTDIPKARFFEFEYTDNGKSLGNVAITLDEDDGVVVQISGNLADSKHHGAFRFIRSFRSFAKDRLLKFDIQNIGKSELDKRDYAFQAKPKEETMEPMMESKMYGTARMSYQDLGEAKLIVKHSQPINVDLAAGRTMHIEGIWVENADGERFKYPYKHLNGARALAEHLKAGGNPYDGIGQHITSLSEELAQLRKFKNYVGRNATLSEAMDDINGRVNERIESVKKEVQSLQRPTYYQQFAESFTANESQEIPEEILNDWIDRLTIRTFNEELKTAFPYIYRLVGENIAVKELSADDLLDEAGSPAQQAAIAIAKKKAKKVSEDPEDQFENFINSIVEDGEQEGENEIFSADMDKQSKALNKLKSLIAGDLKPGVDGVNASLSLKGIIDSPLFASDYLDGMSDNDDVGTMVKKYFQDLATGKITDDSIQGADIGDIKDIAQGIVASKSLDSAGNETPVGGEEVPPAAAAPAPAPEAPAAPAPAPEAPAAAAPAPEQPAPVAEGSDEDPPFDPDPPRKNPIAKAGKHGQGYSTARHLARAGLIKAIHTAKKHGAQLDTTLDFGDKEKTLHDCIIECGMDPKDFGFGQDENESGVDQMLKSISGFWNKEAKNFTIGGTRAKTKVVKDFKNGEFGNASEEDLQQVLHMIDKMDPSGDTSSELGHIRHLAGMHNQVADESGFDMPDMGGMMKGMNMPKMPDMPQMPQGGSNSSSYTVNGKSVNKAEHDAFMAQHPELGKAQQMLKQRQAPKVSWDPAVRQQQTGGNRRVSNTDFNFEESTELTAMLKIAGLR